MALDISEHVEAFGAQLRSLGYAPFTLEAKIRFVSQFALWVRTRGLSLEDINWTWIERAIKCRPTCVAGRRKALQQFLEHLQQRGIASQPAEDKDNTSIAVLERRYATYLREERGFVAVTLINYLGFIRNFLAERFWRGAVRPARLTHHDVAEFMLRHVQTISPGRAKLMGTALRSFLSFLFLSAETTTDLSRAVPSVRQFRQRAVPKYITSEEVERVLAACDLSTPVGRRDYAILLLLARLGLRGGEVVKLELGDIRWREGELIVRGKGFVRDRLPLQKMWARH